MEETTKKIKDLLTFHGYKFETRYLERAINHHFAHKMPLIQKFKLTPENKWRIWFPLPTNPQNRPLANDITTEIEALNKGYRRLDLSFMWQKKNKVRVTKILPPIIEEWIDHLEKENYNEFYHFDHFYGLTQIARDLRLSLNEPRENIINRILCYYGDYIKAGRVGWISANPYDLFTLSGKGCTYSSCIRVGGEYDNTILDYLESENTLVGYVTEEKDPDKKIGRTMIYASNDIIATSRLYGSMFESDSLVMRDILQSIAGGRWILNGKIEQKYIEKEGYAYIDWSNGTLTTLRDSNPEKIIIPMGICLQCGNNANQDSGLTCDECSDHYDCTCDECGNRMYSNDSYGIDDEGCYCERCYNRLTTRCHHCGETSRTRNMHTAISDGNEELFCEYCLENYTTACDKCGTSIDNEDIIEIDDRYYCDECVIECARCGEHILPIYDYCENCEEEIAKEEQRKEKEEELKQFDEGEEYEEFKIAI